jgi:hypothetical protein
MMIFSSSYNLSLHAQLNNNIVYMNERMEQDRRYLESNDYQKDFLLFIDLIKTTHPAFSPSLAPPFDIDSIEETGHRWCNKCQSKEEFSDYLQKIMVKLKDGHSYVLPDFNYNLLYPFNYFIDNQDIYLSVVNKEYEEYLGKRITHLNHYPIWDVIISFQKNISSANDKFSLMNVPNYMSFFSLWQLNPYISSDSSLTIGFSDGSSIVLHPISKTKMDISLVKTLPTNSPFAQKDKLFFYTILADPSICYFQFNQCFDQSCLRYLYDMSGNKISKKELKEKLAVYPRFDTIVAQMFKDIKTNKIKTLVIDVRHNSGGNSLLCDVLLSYLKNAKEMKQWHNFIRTSQLWKDHYPKQYNEYSQILQKKDKEIEMGKLYDIDEFNDANFAKRMKQISKYFKMNKKPSQLFSGNVIFLQGGKTYRSAGLLIIDAVDNHIGTIIGEEGSYTPCDYGDILSWELPNTHINGGISHQCFNRGCLKSLKQPHNIY